MNNCHYLKKKVNEIANAFFMNENKSEFFHKIFICQMEANRKRSVLL